MRGLGGLVCSSSNAIACASKASNKIGHLLFASAFSITAKPLVIGVQYYSMNFAEIIYAIIITFTVKSIFYSI